MIPFAFSALPLFPPTTFSSPSPAHRPPPLSSALHGTCLRRRGIYFNAVLQSQCTLPCPKESSFSQSKDGVEELEILGLGFQRPYAVSFGDYIVQEAVRDEEYWAAAWLRAEIYSEGRLYFRTLYGRYIDSYRKRFAEQEFTALKRRCFGKQGQCIQCICLVAVTSEGSQMEIGVLPQHTLRDRVVGTLDISTRQLLRGRKFPKEVITTSLLSIMEPEHRYGYISNVCVTRSARRKGIASNLLKVAIKAAKCWKLKELYVHVDPNNIAAQQLYKKIGFQVVEGAVSDASLKQEELLCMCI